ncbi:hypothetical protein [Methanosarcina horonobensis]|nr:hypothetical protein [Methanosarcina horonobensis]
MGERKLDTEGCQGIKFRNVTPEVFSCMKKKTPNLRDRNLTWRLRKA